MKRIGNMLYELRESLGVSQSDLVECIMSISELSRLEAGKKEVDYVVLSTVFERLGKSLDKLELVVSEENYRILHLREEIQEALYARNYLEFSKKTDEFKRYGNKKNCIHHQYMMQMQAICDFLQDGNIEKCLDAFIQAMELTFLNWKRWKGEKIYLSGQEWKNILIIAQLQIQADRQEQGYCLLNQACNYIETYITDEEQKVKIYPHAVFLLGNEEYNRNHVQRAYELCQKGKKCLTDNGTLILMNELLCLEEKCLKQMGMEKVTNMTAHYRNAIKFLYDTVNKKQEEVLLLLLMQSSTQSEYAVSNEMIRKRREANGITQEALSDGICTQETLSRIERGKRSPNKKNFYQMMRKMGNYGGVYYSYIVAQQYSLYEMIREYGCSISKGEREKAGKLLSETERKLDMSIPVNKQFVMLGHLEEALYRKELTPDKICNELKELLYLTMPPIAGKDMVYRMPYREEVFILNNMAIAYERDGNYQEALSIYRQIMQQYEDSRVLMVHHAVPGLVLYINYVAVLEELDKLEEAEKVGKEGIIHYLNCKRGDNIGKLLGNMSCIYHKMGKIEIEKQFLMNAYYMFRLYDREKQSELVKKIYTQNYGKLQD